MVLAALVGLLTAAALPTISTVHYIETSPSGWCTTDIRYPQIAGEPSEAAGPIDSALRKRFLDDVISRGSYTDYQDGPVSHPSMADCEQRLELLRTKLGPWPPGDHPRYVDDGRFRVGYESAAFVSLVGSAIESYARQPYPNTSWSTANIDVEADKVLGFGDVFKSGATHRKRLDRLIRISIERQWGADVAASFDRSDSRGDPNPLVCPGGIRFYGIFHLHALAAVTAFVSGRDLVAADVINSRKVLDVIEEPRTSTGDCGSRSTG